MIVLALLDIYICYKSFTRDLLVILGSGFSQPAEPTIGEEINDYFMRDNCENILQFGSGEFKLVDFANDAEKGNINAGCQGDWLPRRIRSFILYI